MNDPVSFRFSDTFATAVIFLVITGSLSMLVYLFARFEFSDLSTIRGAIFIGGPLIVIMVAIIVLRTGQELRLAITVSGLCAVCAVFAAEIYLQMRPPAVAPTPEEYAKENGLPFDSRSRKEVAADLRRDYGQVFPPGVGGQLTALQEDGNRHSPLKIEGRELIPLSSVANAPILFCNTNGQWVWYWSDEQGFNNPPGLWRPNDVELMVVGSSFTHGTCEPRGKNMVDTIRKHIPKTINAGLPAIFAYDMLALTREFASVVRPKTVLWVINSNALSKLEPFFPVPLLDRYMTSKQSRLQRLFENKSKIDLILKAFYDQKSKDNLTRNTAIGRQPFSYTDVLLLRRLRLNIGLDMGGGKHNYAWFEKLIGKAKAETETWGGSFVLAFIPVITQFRGLSRTKQYQIEIRDKFKRIAARMEVPLIDTSPIFDALEDPTKLFMPVDLHFNTLGYQKVGTFIAQEINKINRD